MLRDRGEPFTAIPVFPRRLFSASRWYVNAAAGIRTPADLVGRRVGLSSYQTTLSMLAKGDLERKYGVPWREIIWVAATEEPMPFDLPAGARLELVPPGVRLDTMLLDACSPTRRPRSASTTSATATGPRCTSWPSKRRSCASIPGSRRRL